MSICFPNQVLLVDKLHVCRFTLTVEVCACSLTALAYCVSVFLPLSACVVTVSHFP